MYMQRVAPLVKRARSLSRVSADCDIKAALASTALSQKTMPMLVAARRRRVVAAMPRSARAGGTRRTLRACRSPGRREHAAERRLRYELHRATRLNRS